MTRGELWHRFISQLKIRTRDRRIVNLRYNEPQTRVWNLVKPKIDRGEPIRLIIYKARREGISTEVSSWLMAFVASSDLTNALVTAHMSKPAKRIWGMSKLFVTTSPMLSKLATIGNNTITIGRSTLEVATAGSPESERSGDLTAWLASEAAFYPHPEVMTATMQTLPHRKDIFSIGVIESTPNGRVGDGAEFYNEWKRAEEGESDWMPVFLPWHEFGEYRLDSMLIEEPDAEEVELRKRFELTDGQLAWRRWAIANLCQGDLDRFHQEYPATAEEGFIQSGLPFFRTEHLLPLEQHVRPGQRGVVALDGRFTPQGQGWLEVFRMPQQGHTYVIGADSSMGMSDDEGKGQGKSRSAGEVIDMETLEQVAEYDAATAPHVMARHLIGIGNLYNEALIAPEVQSSGGGGGRELLVYIREAGYWNIHRWKGHPDKIQRTPAVLYGWETNARTRPRMLARIREVVMERSAIIHSRRLFNQLAAFGENDAGRLEALQGHDDLLFAWGIAIMSRSENYYRMPAYEAPRQQVDWKTLGVRVDRQETPMDRLQRILTTTEWEQPEKSFLEL